MQSFINVNQPNDLSATVVAHGGNHTPLSVRVYAQVAPNNSVMVDLSHMADMDLFQSAQCIFVDNSDNDGDLIIDIGETGQRIISRKGKQGYYPILATKRARFTISTTGKKSLNVGTNFLNFTIAQGEW